MITVKWCTDKGNGWYLPALNELVILRDHKDAINATITSLKAISGDAIARYVMDTNELSGDENSMIYWSSSARYSAYQSEIYIKYKTGSDHNYTTADRTNSYRVRALFQL